MRRRIKRDTSQGGLSREEHGGGLNSPQNQRDQREWAENFSQDRVGQRLTMPAQVVPRHERGI